MYTARKIFKALQCINIIDCTNTSETNAFRSSYLIKPQICFPFALSVSRSLLFFPWYWTCTYHLMYNLNNIQRDGKNLSPIMDFSIVGEKRYANIKIPLNKIKYTRTHYIWDLKKKEPCRRLFYIVGTFFSLAFSFRLMYVIPLYTYIILI